MCVPGWKMFGLLLLLGLFSAHAQGFDNMTAAHQLPLYKRRTAGSIDILTTSTGQPVELFEATETLNSNLLLNPFLIESLTHFNRERIQERVVHASGTGALGYFEVTHDITHICRAKLFQEVGKKTQLVARFSLSASNRGTPETNRVFRGLAIKFYTEEGNFDLLTINMEMFFYKDAVKLPNVARASRRNPQTHLFDESARWDYLTRNPESLFMFLRVFGDRGIPDGYRFMPGFAIHVFEVENEQREKHYVKFHLIPDGGLKFLTSEEARHIMGEDPDYATRDMYNAIANGDFPSWTLGIQVRSLQDVKSADCDPFDLTRLWPETDYPVKPIGKIVLNKNSDNFFATIEQAAFSPGNLVPGIRGIDKVFEARTMAYRDAHFHRFGSNPNKIEVNCPIATKARTYNRDGSSPVKDNEKDAPNYHPNSFNGPQPYVDEQRSNIYQIHYTDPGVNNFDQARELYAESISEDERIRLVKNIVFSLGKAEKFLQERAVKLYKAIHPDLGHRVEIGLAEAEEDIS